MSLTMSSMARHGLLTNLSKDYQPMTYTLFQRVPMELSPPVMLCLVIISLRKIYAFGIISTLLNRSIDRQFNVGNTRMHVCVSIQEFK